VTDTPVTDRCEIEGEEVLDGTANPPENTAHVSNPGPDA